MIPTQLLVFAVLYHLNAYGTSASGCPRVDYVVGRLSGAWVSEIRRYKVPKDGPSAENKLEIWHLGRGATSI